MAKALSEHHLLTALDKFISLDDWKNFANEHPKALASCFVSVGIAESDFKKLEEIMKAVPIPFICLDVANGYTERFVSFLEYLRENYPKNSHYGRQCCDRRNGGRINFIRG